MREKIGFGVRFFVDYAAKPVPAIMSETGTVAKP